jgi:predicted nucleic-acid-binding protein
VKILIDTNVVLDLLLEREPFIETAIALFEQIEQGNLEGAIAATTITNIFYIIRKAEGREVALEAIHRLLIGLQFCAVDRQTVETGCIPVLQVCPHPPAPSPKMGEGGQNSKSLSRLGRGI